MISSESINYSKYSIINENNKNLSTDLEMIHQNKKEDKKENNNESNLNSFQTENEKDNDKLIPLPEKEGDLSNNGLLYRNSIEKKNPKFLGKCLALFYNSEGNPRITIGPDCKIIIFNI